MASRPELHAQTALRGIAALVVFIAHASFFQLFPQHPFFGQFYHIFFWHNVAVDLFFELSGFILCYVYLARDFSWKRYALARFSRIYPLYLVGLLIFMLLDVGAYLKTGVRSADLIPQSIIANLLLIQDWPLLPYFRSINVPTWSISVEIFLYIFIFPVLLYGQKYLTLKQKLFLAIIPVALLTGIYAVFPEGEFRAGLSPFRGILCFTSGFFMCTLGLDRGFPGVPRKVEMLILLIAAFCLLFEFPLGRGVAVMAFPFLAYLSASNASLLTALIARPTLCWLGDISYSVYAWHWPILRALGIATGIDGRGNGLFHFPFPHILYVLVALVTVLGIAHLSHFYFERPVSDWIRKGQRH